ncbi:MAG: hydroxymethylglutaryl-CoA lyase [Candidatus Nanopelagicales bacterium]|nr:hydroxymethylglutaryl-CoA lyase [Candidatus Nanopelagicales bacterium]
MSANPLTSPVVEIVEVGPRDGLQNDPADLSTDTKIEFVNRCVSAGARRVEVASFVNPNRVPQMADAEAVLAGLPSGSEKTDGASWIGLMLNERGFDRAVSTPVDEVNLVVMVSETFSERNQGMSTDDAIQAVERIAPRARAAGLRCSVALSAAFGCPFEGEVPGARVVDVAGRLAAAGVDEIALADTIGVAVPRDVRQRATAVRQAVAAETGAVRLRAHFHNTRNTGYANALAAFEAGIGVLDASLGGIGGCPFAPRATGNIATEDLVFALERSGVDTGMDLDALIRAAEWLSEQLGRPLPSLLPKAGPFPGARSR